MFRCRYYEQEKPIAERNVEELENEEYQEGYLDELKERKWDSEREKRKETHHDD